MNFKINEKIVVKFISTTNPNFQDGYPGLIGTLKMMSNGSLYFDNISKWLRTSFVTSMELNEKIITVKTLNSVYVFEMVEDKGFSISELLGENNNVRNRKQVATGKLHIIMK